MQQGGEVGEGKHKHEVGIRMNSPSHAQDGPGPPQGVRTAGALVGWPRAAPQLPRGCRPVLNRLGVADLGPN